MFDSCYNHENVRAVFRCFDCKPDVVVRYCKECHEQVHSLQVFRLHKTQTIDQTEQRKLSQDVSDLETLVAFENDLLKDVLTTLQYTEQQEREMLRDVIIKTEKRLHDIQQCHEKVDKAINYLNKVSSVIKLCSEHNENQNASSPDKLVDKPISHDLKPAEEEAQEQASGALSLAEEFPVLIKSSLSKKGGFWMIRSDSAGLRKVAEIENSIKEHFNAHDLAVIKEGSICVASNQVRTEFWRVRIEKLCKDRMVNVHYLDHGQQENIPIRNIYDIPPAVKQIPYQAMECCLFSFSENISLPYEAKWCFKDMTHGKDIKAKILSKVIFTEGNTLFHVQLTSIAPPPTNINQKVADLIIQQKLIENDRPILPKESLVQHPSEERKQVDSASKPLEQASASIATAEPHDLKKSSEEKTVTSASPSGYPISVPLEESPASSLAPTVPNNRLEKEFVPFTILTKPNSDGSVAVDASRTTVSDPHGLKEPVREGRPLMAIPEYVPIGFLNEQMYDKIFKECKANFTLVKSLICLARFFIINVDEFQLTEAMKTKIWCCTDDALCKNINRVYRDQAARGNHRQSVFLVFLSKINVVGLVRVVSPCYTGPHCTILGRGLLWSNCCKGEFRIDLFNAYKLSTKLLESERFYREMTRENIVGKEMKWEKGCEIIQKYERVKRKSSVLDDACRMYSKDHRKDLASSQENLSEGHLPPSAKDVETELLDRNVGQGKKGRRRRSMEGSDEFLAESSNDGKEQDSTENWDLEAEPVKVAEIYSTITNSAATQDNTCESAVEVQDSTREEKDDSIALPHSESEVLNECAVEDSSIEPNSEGLKAREVEDEVTPSVSVLGDSTKKQEDVPASLEVQSENVSEPIENKTSPDYSNLESTMEGSVTLDASENSEEKVNQAGQPDLESEMMEKDQRNADFEEEGISVQEELPESGEDESVLYHEVVTSIDEQEITESGDPEAVAKQKVEEEMLEDSKMPTSCEHPKMIASEDIDEKLESLQKLENTVQEEQAKLTQDAGVRNGMGTEVKTFPPQERLPSYFHRGLQQPECQPEEDFYVVSPPTETTEASEPQDYGEEKAKRKYEEFGDEKVDPSNGFTTTTSDGNGASIDEKPSMKQEDDMGKGRASPDSIDDGALKDEKPRLKQQQEEDMWEGSASPESIDEDPSVDSSLASKMRASPETMESGPSTDSSPSSCSAKDTTDASSDWLTGNADVICEEGASDNEETIGFLPVEPGLEYRVMLMSRPNQDSIFCARIYRNYEEEQEYKQFCKRLNAATEKRNEKVTNVFVMKNCCLKMRKPSGTYKRVLIKKLLGKGRVGIHFTDIGYGSEIPIDDLREMDSEFQVSFPPQSFECRILNYINKQDKIKISKLPPKNSKRGYNIELEIVVKSIAGEVAEVNVLRVRQTSHSY